MTRNIMTSSRRWAGATALVLLLGLTGPLTAQAETYRLVAGDRVGVSIFGEQESWETSIDLDGSLRLPALGRVQAEGMTLDEAEAALKARIEQTGLYISPRVSLSILDYAPVLVTGAVRAPGLFEYMPQLTARTTAGLAGGVAATGVDGTGLSLQATDFASKLKKIETDMLSVLLRKARVEAQLEDQDQIDFDAGRDVPFSNVDTGLLHQLLSREQAILTEEKQGLEELQHLRQVELDNVVKQISLLEERSKVQDGLIALQQEEVEAAETLESRGLRTRMDMARVERATASLQAQVLDIEAALSQARTRQADIASTMTQTRSARRVKLLEDSAELRAALEQLGHDRQAALAKMLIVGDSSALTMLGEADTIVRFEIRRRRDGVFETISAAPDDRIMPGDTLQVYVSAGTDLATGTSAKGELRADLADVN